MTASSRTFVGLSCMTSSVNFQNSMPSVSIWRCDGKTQLPTWHHHSHRPSQGIQRQIQSFLVPSAVSQHWSSSSDRISIDRLRRITFCIGFSHTRAFSIVASLNENAGCVDWRSTWTGLGNWNQRVSTDPGSWSCPGCSNGLRSHLFQNSNSHSDWTVGNLFVWGCPVREMRSCWTP